ncbi:sialate O-acetylesterase [Tenacibaculum xiamenense]|uniref:sialate O-acetylesterase n=1 Tax=Tenacibaculum xiamenense TaxID=1261553 RepID=UPI00389442A7
MFKKTTLGIFVFLALTSVSFCFSQDTNFHIYLCFGQSNMEGAGIIEQIDKVVPENFVVLQGVDCPDNRKKGTWRAAIPPLCQCESGLSPADYFGRTMVENLPNTTKIGVINVSISGCDIRLFDKELYTSYDDTHKADWFNNIVKSYGGNPYERLIDLARKAQKDGVIKGILLHQGESNTGDAKWPNYVSKIHNDLLHDLNLNSKEVPLLVGEVASQENSCCSSMNLIINKIPETINNAHVISSKDCTTKDVAHFTSEGYRELGKRYALKMLDLLKVDNTKN